MILISYRKNGESGRCGRGCCGPDNTWDSFIETDVVGSLAEAVKLAVQQITNDEHEYPEHYEFYLIRPATVSEIEMGDFESPFQEGIEGCVHGDLAKFDMKQSKLFQSRLETIRAEKTAAKRISDEKFALKVKKDNEARELEQLRKPKEKFPNG